METSDISLVHWWLKVCLSRSSFSGTPAVTICKGLWTSVLAHLMLMKCHSPQKLFCSQQWVFLVTGVHLLVIFFVSRASGYLQAQLLRLTIGRLSDIGITVPAVTSDASAHSCSDGKGPGDTSRRRQHEVYISASFIFQPTDCLLLILATCLN